MSREITYSGQSFYNKVVECTGDIENAFAMLLLNKKTSTTERLQVGEVLKVSEVTDYEVVDYFTELNRPATLKDKIIVEATENYLLPGEFPFSF